MIASLKDHSDSAIDANKNELRDLSSEIWNNPELGMEEYQAHKVLTVFLEGKGFTVERSYTNIPTAFKATYGSGSPNVCVICEYDALPEIGHACGHNLIAEAGVAAGLGLKAAMEKGNMKGTVTVMGTPAEEADGGKVMLLKNGGFKGIDVAMMVHPFPQTYIRPAFSAIKCIKIEYTGLSAHAAAYPWEGKNALDAVVLAYNSISVLRQQMKPTWRVHSVISKGGVKPNIIPEYCEMRMYCRAPVSQELNTLLGKVQACLVASAQATNCSVNVVDDDVECSCLDVRQNSSLAGSFGRHLSALGVEYEDVYDTSASTDMGDVSYVVPSLHPCYAIGTGEVNHTRAFTAVANTPGSHHKTLVAAKAMASTAIDVYVKDGFLAEVRENFKNF